MLHPFLVFIVRRFTGRLIGDDGPLVMGLQRPAAGLRLLRLGEKLRQRAQDKQGQDS